MNLFLVSLILNDSSFYEWLYSPCGPWPLFSFVIYSQSVWLLRRVISLSQGLYLNAGQHKYRINTYTHQILWNSNPASERASEDSSCLRPRGHCDWHGSSWGSFIVNVSVINISFSWSSSAAIRKGDVFVVSLFDICTLRYVITQLTFD
jgi:hypothetical protein